MNTRYLKVNAAQPETEVIIEAAQLIKKQELVAFPTETVYGLGAAAFCPPAVEKIFIAKGRPAANPLLVHVSNFEQVQDIAREIPPVARLLMDKLWPGPLSLILPARDKVPDIVRGGKDSVGLRMPSHPVALALIEQAGPLAAPSANLSGRPSPVTAGHVKSDLDGRIAAVLDAGATGLGLESTIIDLSIGSYRVLRRGGVSMEELEKLLDEKIEVDLSASRQFAHYQTTTRIIVAENKEEFEEDLKRFSGLKAGAVIYDNNSSRLDRLNEAIDRLRIYDLDLQSTGNNLYMILRDAEAGRLDVLLFAPLPPDLTGTASSWADRIRQAASKMPEREV